MVLPSGPWYGIQNIEKHESPPSSPPNKISWDLNIQSAGTDWPEHMGRTFSGSVFSRGMQILMVHKHVLGFLYFDIPWQFGITFLTWAAT